MVILENRGVREGKCCLFDKLSFEIELISTLSRKFTNNDSFMYEMGLLETKLEQDESSFQIQDSPFFITRGTISGYYGLVTLELNCTGNGYVDFTSCFESHSIEKCMTHFEKEDFEKIFGVGYQGENVFENYLNSFMITGELYPNLVSQKLAEVRNLNNTALPIFGRKILTISNSLLLHSVQDYFKQFNVDC
mgnify:CR=1 FL=1